MTVRDGIRIEELRPPGSSSVLRRFSEDEQDRGLKTLRYGLDILREVGAVHWISSGTALGLHREQRLIPGDTDVDVSIYAVWDGGSYGMLGGDINDAFTDIGWLPMRRLIGHGPDNESRVMQLAVRDELTDTVFDMYFCYAGRDPNTLVNYNTSCVLQKPASLVEPLGTLTVDDLTVPAPNDMEAYLHWRYGPSWVTPSKAKGIYNGTWG